jgi:Uma2 family endonuclease
MLLAGGETGNRNAAINAALYRWAKMNGTGVAFDSSTGFNLPNGAMRSPDAAWVLRNRLTSLTPEQKRKFLPLCPDFVIELQSPSDTLEGLQGKLQEYIDNGAQLGWLIEPDTHSVYIYCPGQEPEHLQSPGYVNGDPVLPNFVLDLTDIWEPGF